MRTECLILCALLGAYSFSLFLSGSVVIRSDINGKELCIEIFWFNVSAIIYSAICAIGFLLAIYGFVNKYFDSAKILVALIIVIATGFAIWSMLLFTTKGTDCKDAWGKQYEALWTWYMAFMWSQISILILFAITLCCCLYGDIPTIE